jgi:hypothetical protein
VSLFDVPTEAADTWYVIEFRSGSFFRSLEDDHGVSREEARRFESHAEATDFANRHPWIWFNGGMIVEVSR